VVFENILENTFDYVAEVDFVIFYSRKSILTQTKIALELKKFSLKQRNLCLSKNDTKKQLSTKFSLKQAHS